MKLKSKLLSFIMLTTTVLSPVCIVNAADTNGDVDVSEKVVLATDCGLSESEKSELVLAVINNELDKVKRLTKEGNTDIINAKYCDNNTSLLHSAASAGATTVARYLIENGANVNAVTIHGNTPLHTAIQRCKLLSGYERSSMVSLLIESGADLNAKNNRGWTPYQLAINYPRENPSYKMDIRTVIILTDALSKHVFESIKSCDLEGVKKYTEEQGLSETGKTVIYGNVQNQFTPLQLAASLGQLEMVKYMIEQGANPNVRTSDGYSPLELAAFENHMDVVAYLAGVQKKPTLTHASHR